MSPRDFVISFFAVVKQSSFACLGQGHKPQVGFSRSEFSLFACESSHGLVPGQANMRNCIARLRLRHIWEHMMSHRRRELRLNKARHLWASAVVRARKH